MTTARWSGVVIAGSDHVVTVEGNAYSPGTPSGRTSRAPSDSPTVCPWKGTPSCDDGQVEGAVGEDAVRYAPTPEDAGEAITDRVA